MMKCITLYHARVRVKYIGTLGALLHTFLCLELSNLNFEKCDYLFEKNDC